MAYLSSLIYYDDKLFIFLYHFDIIKKDKFTPLSPKGVLGLLKNMILFQF